MGARTTVVTTVVAATLCFPMAGVAAAQDRDCNQFATQAQAQAFFNNTPGDPFDLDRDNDGRACEWLPNGRYEDNTTPGTAPTQTGVPNPDGGATPTRGVETGAGGTADLITAADDTTDDDSGPLVPLGVAGAVLAAGGLVLARRRSVGKRD
jgi:hypothetical protein